MQPIIFKVFKMKNFELEKKENEPSFQSLQHHLKAAEHFDMAFKTHKEAAKLIEENKQTASQVKLKVAKEHAAKVQYIKYQISKN